MTLRGTRAVPAAQLRPVGFSSLESEGSGVHAGLTSLRASGVGRPQLRTLPRQRAAASAAQVLSVAPWAAWLRATWAAASHLLRPGALLAVAGSASVVRGPQPRPGNGDSVGSGRAALPQLPGLRSRRASPRSALPAAPAPGEQRVPSLAWRARCVARPSWPALARGRGDRLADVSADLEAFSGFLGRGPAGGDFPIRPLKTCWVWKVSRGCVAAGARSPVSLASVPSRPVAAAGSVLSALGMGCRLRVGVCFAT